MRVVGGSADARAARRQALRGFLCRRGATRAHALNPKTCAVDGGEQAVLFDRLKGVLPNTQSEGTHFLVPWLQKAVIFDIRTRPRSISSVTGTKGATGRPRRAARRAGLCCQREARERTAGSFVRRPRAPHGAHRPLGLRRPRTPPGWDAHARNGSCGVC
jgi:hypothetical protein